jgi:hypothetical protein
MMIWTYVDEWLDTSTMLPHHAVVSRFVSTEPHNIRVGKKRMMRPIIGLQTTCTCIAIVFRQCYTTDVFTATGITYLAIRPSPLICPLPLVSFSITVVTSTC